MKKIGLLGGSFDPVHLAHIALAEAAWRALQLDHVELIPAAQPWQREPLSISPQQRLAMLQRAIAQRPYLRINTAEIDRGGKTYTIDTIKALPPGADYYWILGSDQLDNFCSWHCWQEIARRVHLAVAHRPGTSRRVPDALMRHLSTTNRSLIDIPFQPMAVSATAIRQNLASGQAVDGLLDVAVAQYIKQHKLYQSPLT